MTLRDWFKSKRNKNGGSLNPEAVNMRLSDEELCKLWTKCFNCSENLPTKELHEALFICKKCGYHFRIDARTRIEQLTDGFAEWDSLLVPANPLGFEDTEPYVTRQKKAAEKSQLNEAIVTGLGMLGSEAVALGVMDFGYMGGTLGSVVGEKITRLAEGALSHQLPMILFCASGGARMQEGNFSLMQMVKTSAALGRMHEAGLLYITVLTEPTYGGVTASYGMLGDVIIAEEGARIGFAGRRVIEQTIRQKLPSDFQTANYLLKYGQVDMVLHRTELKNRLMELVRLHRLASGKSPELSHDAVVPNVMGASAAVRQEASV
jgi:acetyl-CoA carboxylase carboxyl transferase subunit beta